MAVGTSPQPALNVTITLSLGGEPIPGNISGVKPLQGLLPVNLIDGSFTLDLHPWQAEAFLFNCTHTTSPPDAKNPVVNPSMEDYVREHPLINTPFA
jgi:hypothetical protein